MIPLSRWQEFGLRRRLLDNPSNRVLCCHRCNAEKGNMHPREWLALHPEYASHFAAEAKYLSNAIRFLVGLPVRR